MLNILLAEDHQLVRNGIRLLLEKDGDIKIVGEAENGLQALEMLRDGERVDVILADVNMPELDGISLISEVKGVSPDTHVIILSMHDNDKYISKAFSGGASGYLLKNVGADELIFSLKHVSAGGEYICAELGLKMMRKNQEAHQSAVEQREHIQLSDRELEVMQLIADGLTSGQMSEKLFLSKRTVEGHRQSLFAKTGAQNSASLVRYGILNGIVK